ncbi:MAG: hypothetical protein O7G87_06465, partial [bacterium]|nr:hypothetical protein [bacterium]
MKRVLPVSLGFAVLIVVGMVFYWDVKVPYSIETAGKFLPQKEWVLVRGQDGRLISTLYDHVRGKVEDFDVMHVENGDNLTFKLHPAIVAGATVAVGDT